MESQPGGADLQQMLCIQIAKVALGAVQEQQHLQRKNL